MLAAAAVAAHDGWPGGAARGEVEGRRAPPGRGEAAGLRLARRRPARPGRRGRPPAPAPARAPARSPAPVAPLAAPKVVRSASWRRPGRSRAAAKAGRSSAPSAAPPPGCCRRRSPAPGGRGTRGAPGRRRAAQAAPSVRAPRARGGRCGGPRRALPGRRRPSISAASPATVGALEEAADRQLDAEARPGPGRSPGWRAGSGRRGRRRRRERETAPGSTPSSSAQIAASPLLGAGPPAGRRPRPPPRGARDSGAGSASRSTLPAGVRGISAEGDQGRGHHVAGRPSRSDASRALFSRRRSSPPAIGGPRAARSRPAQPGRVGVAGAVVPGHDHRLAPPPGGAERTASISPSSMRKPRTLTWWSIRPRKSIRPSGR